MKVTLISKIFHFGGKKRDLRFTVKIVVDVNTNIVQPIYLLEANGGRKHIVNNDFYNVILCAPSYLIGSIYDQLDAFELDNLKKLLEAEGERLFVVV